MNQWMISNLRVLSKKLLDQTLSCSTRELLQRSTESSRIPASRKRSLEPTILSRIMQTRFTVVLRNDDLREFVSTWDEILLPMTQIPSDEILESLFKLRIRESEKLKTVLELYDLGMHQKKKRT